MTDKIDTALAIEEKAVKEDEEENNEMLSHEVTRDACEEREQPYERIKSKIEILDVMFHPTENNLISLGLINGKLKMLVYNFPDNF